MIRTSPLLASDILFLHMFSPTLHHIGFPLHLVPRLLASTPGPSLVQSQPPLLVDWLVSHTRILFLSRPPIVPSVVRIDLIIPHLREYHHPLFVVPLTFSTLPHILIRLCTAPPCIHLKMHLIRLALSDKPCSLNLSTYGPAPPNASTTHSTKKHMVSRPSPTIHESFDVYVCLLDE